MGAIVWNFITTAPTLKSFKMYNYSYSYEMIQSMADYLLKRVRSRPKIGIICGSGLGELAFVTYNCQMFITLVKS